MVDFLENVALKKDDLTLAGISQIELKTRPIVLDNIYNQQEFNDGIDLINFLHCIDHYEAQDIDFNAFIKELDGKQTVFVQEVVQLKTNKIPKGLVALERVFDGNEKEVMKQTPVRREDVEEINLGTELAPKKVYIGKKISPIIKKMFITLLIKYKHVFAWSYDDLKAYR